MKNEIEYKEGTILTDGKGFIRIGLVHEKDWSPQNNYGRKRIDYSLCSHYPASKDDPNNFYMNGDLIYLGSTGNIPGLWFQRGYWLNKFRPISGNLIHPEILKKLDL